MEKIDTIEGIIANLDPTEPLRGELLKKFYVNCDDVRGGKIALDLARKLSTHRAIRLLFTGHSGCGNSTELHRLIEELKDKLFIVYFVTTDLLDIFDASYTDILLAIGRELYSQAKKNQLKLNKSLIEEIEEWFTQVYHETIKEVGGSSLSLKTPILEIDNLLKSSQYKEVTRKIVDRRISELLQRLNSLIATIKVAAKKDLLIIIDNLDRMPPDKAEEVFINHGTQLGALGTKVVYTFPIHLCYSIKANVLDQNFHYREILPMIRINNKDNSEFHKGRERLKEIVYKRMNPSLFDITALDALVYFSAGHIRHLFQLILEASFSADIRRANKIEVEDVKEAVRKFRNNYIRQIPTDCYALLKKVYETKKIENDLTHQTMLYNLTILEYNAEQFYDLHSIVKLILTQEKLIEDVQILRNWHEFII